MVDSLDKHMQNEKELIRLRRFMPAARTTRARSAQFRLRRELPYTRVVQILPAAQTTCGIYDWKEVQEVKVCVGGSWWVVREEG